MSKSGQYYLPSESLESGSQSQQYFTDAIPSIDNRMCYSFNAIDIKGICDKIRIYIR